MIDLNSDIAITIISMLAAFGSFLLVVLPMVLRTEKKEHFRKVIEKKRKDLFEETKRQAKDRANSHSKEHTAAQSMAALYRLQKIAGNASVQARNLMLQAGIRKPAAPLIYLVSRIVIPIVFSLLAMMFIAGADKDFSNSTTSMIILTAALTGFFLPRVLIKNMADKRQQEISISFPDSLDMIFICVQGGIGIEGSINKIAEAVSDHSETLAEELGLLSAELGMLNDRRAAFQGFATRVGSGAARSFATAMLQAEQYGTSVSKAIRVLADDQREQRMATAEQKAASLPPKLTVPMILFFLPALFITILGPAFIGAP